MRMRDALERDIGIELAELELEWDKKVAGATLYQPKSTCCTPKGDVDEASMAAEAAEQRITQALQKELEKVDKECMRPLQVRSLSL